MSPTRMTGTSPPARGAASSDTAGAHPPSRPTSSTVAPTEGPRVLANIAAERLLIEASTHGLSRTIEQERVSDVIGPSENLTEVASIPAHSASASAGWLDPASVLDASDDAIVAYSLDKVIMLWNRGAEHLYGYTASEALGQQRSLIVPSSERDPERWQRIVAGERVPASESIRTTKDGTPVVVATTLSRVLDPAGEVVGVVAVGRNVTDRARIQAAFDDAHARALDASRLKSEFVANVNHELRTPMNGVIGITHLLAETSLDDEQRTYVDALTVSGEALMAVVTDILDFSKIEADKIAFQDAPFAPRALAEDVRTIITLGAESGRVEMVASFGSDLPELLLGDAGRVRQVLLNLVGNAWKFTDSGEVTIRMTWTDEEADSGQLLVEVIDTGVGIDDSELDLIFRPFTQADGSTTRRHGGTGLGLTIAKELVELMGGAIGVRSTVGVGTTFWFTLPLRRAGRDELARAPSSLEDVRVLVADSQPASRSALEQELRAHGAAVTTAPDPVAALTALRAAARSGQPHDVVFLHLNLSAPTISELIRSIKADGTLAGVGIIAVTPPDYAGDVEDTDARVAEPATEHDLLAAVLRVLDAPTDEEPTDHRPLHPHDDPELAPAARVLVAEDNPINQLVLVRMLERRGFDVDVADNGREAVDMHTHKPYDAIFMDCQLPELDGYQATREIRSLDAARSRIPIIAVTANTMPGDAERCRAAGMDFYAAKPIGAAGLDHVLSQALPPTVTPSLPRP
jgi:two-component system sensor histidine kinase/response regulator